MSNFIEGAMAAVCDMKRNSYLRICSVNIIMIMTLFYFIIIHRYVRLNRDRLKGASGEVEALLGLNVLFEVLMTMSQIMSPFTPFFAEYLYQNLRKLQPLYGNLDDTVAVDSSGNVIMILSVFAYTVEFSNWMIKH